MNYESKYYFSLDTEIHFDRLQTHEQVRGVSGK